MILIGIPCFNEEKHVAEVIKKAKFWGEVVVLDDGSTDGTARVAEEAGATVYRHPHSGYGSSISQLFSIAKNKNADVLITLDGDGQHSPDEIFRFINALKTSDVVTGNRFLGKTDIPKYRKLGINFISSLAGVNDSQCGFRGYNRKAIENIKVTEKGMGASLEILRRAKDLNLIIKEIPCTISYKDTEHSQSSVKHGLVLFETLFWGGVWNHPVLLLGLPSLISLFSGVLFSVWLLVEYSQTRWFSPSLAFLSLGGILVGVILSFSLLSVLIGKRLLDELR